MSGGGGDCDFSHCSRCKDWIRTKIIQELCKKALLSLTNIFLYLKLPKKEGKEIIVADGKKSPRLNVQLSADLNLFNYKSRE